MPLYDRLFRERMHNELFQKCNALLDKTLLILYFHHGLFLCYHSIFENPVFHAVPGNLHWCQSHKWKQIIMLKNRSVSLLSNLRSESKSKLFGNIDVPFYWKKAIS